MEKPVVIEEYNEKWLFEYQQVGVSDLKEVEEFIEPLAKIGYEHVHHKEFPNRRFFR